MGKKSRKKREKRQEIKSEEDIIYKKEKPKGAFSSVCLNIIRIGVYLVLLTPFVLNSKCFFPFVGPKSVYFCGLVEIIFFAWILLIICNAKYRPRKNILTIALVLFLIVLILSSIFGIDFSRSFWSKYERMTGLLMFFHLFAFFLVISSTFKNKKDWIKIFGVSVCLALVMGIMKFLSSVGVNFFSEELTLSSKGGLFLGNTSFLGTYLLFNVFIALYLFFNTKKWFKIFFGISLLIMLGAIFLSGARAAFVSVIGAFVLLFLLWLVFQKNKKIRCFGIPLLIIYFFTAIAGLWLVFHPGNIISNKFAQLATKSRFATAEMSIKALQEKPILGWGPENFHVVFSKYFDPRFFLQEYGGEVWFDRAHNIIFDTLVISGILGFLAYLIIFLSAFYILWKKYFQTKFDFWISGIFSVLLIAYFVQDLTVFDMVSSYMMLFLVLGFIASIQQFPLGNNTQQTSLKQSESEPSVFLSFIILVIFFICFFKFTIQPFKADTDVVKALKTPNSNERLELYKKTLNTSPLGKYQIRESFADNLMRISKSKDANKIPKDNLIKEFEFLSNELEDSIRESPLCLRSELKLGQMYNTYALFDKSKLSRAEEVLNDALNLSPRNQQVYWALSQTKIYQRDIQAGLSLAEKAVELEPRVKSSHLIVIQIAKLISKDLAQEKANKAIKINPLWEEQIKKLLEDKK